MCVQVNANSTSKSIMRIFNRRIVYKNGEWKSENLTVGSTESEESLATSIRCTGEGRISQSSRGNRRGCVYLAVNMGPQRWSSWRGWETVASVESVTPWKSTTCGQVLGGR